MNQTKFYLQEVIQKLTKTKEKLNLNIRELQLQGILYGISRGCIIGGIARVRIIIHQVFMLK